MFYRELGERVSVDWVFEGVCRISLGSWFREFCLTYKLKNFKTKSMGLSGLNRRSMAAAQPSVMLYK
jgi:hypothetical protein